MANSTNNNRGYIALLAVTIIGISSLSLALMAQSEILNYGLSASDSDNFRQAVELARSCFEEARANIASEADYVGNEQLNIGSNQCVIETINNTAGLATITSSAQYHNSIAKLLTKINSDSLKMISQKIIN